MPQGTQSPGKEFKVGIGPFKGLGPGDQNQRLWVGTFAFVVAGHPRTLEGESLMILAAYTHLRKGLGERIGIQAPTALKGLRFQTAESLRGCKGCGLGILGEGGFWSDPNKGLNSLRAGRLSFSSFKFYCIDSKHCWAV